MEEEVYNYLMKIHREKAVTYDIALYLGNKILARVVGGILYVNPEVH